MIAGMILVSESGRRYVTAWNEMPLQISAMRIWQTEPEQPKELETVEQPQQSDETEPVTEEPPEEQIDRYIEPTKSQIRKIQRQEIAMLPRCEWRVANNSFLLHGYYNYHYLILLEEEDQLWLGVPGIYHRREAKAAEVFGFTRFVQADQDAAEENEMFGYWCRKVRHMKSR